MCTPAKTLLLTVLINSKYLFQIGKSPDVQKGCWLFYSVLIVKPPEATLRLVTQGYIT